MHVPENVPKPGFYYHHKHDPNGAVYMYAYEVIGVGSHTESDCRPEDALMVVYRPLYSSAKVYQAGKLFDLRPLSMWLETVTKDGEVVPRFRQITDPQVIMLLEHIRAQMYW